MTSYKVNITLEIDAESVEQAAALAMANLEPPLSLIMDVEDVDTGEVIEVDSDDLELSE